jgi:hypothetical protein
MSEFEQGKKDDRWRNEHWQDAQVFGQVLQEGVTPSWDDL